MRRATGGLMILSARYFLSVKRCKHAARVLAVLLGCVSCLSLRADGIDSAVPAGLPPASVQYAAAVIRKMEDYLDKLQDPVAAQELSVAEARDLAEERRAEMRKLLEAQMNRTQSKWDN